MSRKVVILSIKPKYARMIYDGIKRWEFRKAPPPVPGWVLLYESAPVSAVTGTVYLGARIQGESECVWDLVKHQKSIGNGTGITLREFRSYVGPKRKVAACATFFAERFDSPVPLPAHVHPPQNYGTYVIADDLKGGAK